MALHRDIYWVGSQWAVTGYGIQACDQKQKGRFDIEACQIWEAGVLEGMRALTWLNIGDFDRAIEIARLHYPEPPRKAPPTEDRVVGLIETMLKEFGRKAESQKAEGEKASGSQESPIEPEIPALQIFEMRIESWPAKFVPQWRIRVKR
jgi:hypothetical protein